MAVKRTRAREDSYIRALMVLGKRPRRPAAIGLDGNYPKREVGAYKAMVEYDDRVQLYFIHHILQNEPRFVGISQPGWIADFYHWQDLHACKGEQHESNTQP